MAAARKISVLKILRFGCTLVGVAGFVVAVMSATRQQAHDPIRGVDIRITNSNIVRFIDKEDLADLLFHRRNIKAHDISYEQADVNRLEKIARSNPWLQEAQVYIDNQRVLHVQATQRIPVVRIFEENGNSYYLDTALKHMPLSPGYAHYVAVVTQMPAVAEDAAGKALKEKVLYVVQKLSKHNFWKQGVEEIAYRPDGGFELIPVLGSHRAVIGDTSALDAKLQNLFLFYKNVLNRIGWDRYTVLDARFNNQVVASPSLPWKPPVDRALSNMNWVKTIVKEEITDTLSAKLAARENARKPDTSQRRRLIQKPPAIEPASAKKTEKKVSKPANGITKSRSVAAPSQVFKKEPVKPAAVKARN